MATSRSSTVHRPAILLVACLSSGSAAAGGSVPEASRATEAIRVELDAPGACGNAAAFFDAVRARTPNVRPSQGDPRERLFSIEISESTRAFDGTLRVVDPAGQSSERTLSADSCQELIEALAIITALAVDPDSGSAAASLASASAAGPPENGEAPGVVAPASPAVSAAPRDEPANPPSPLAAKNSLPLSWFLGAGAGIDRLPGAVLFPTGSLTLEAGVARRSVFSPSVRLALRRSLEATLTSGSGSAALALTTVRVEICPLRVQRTEALRFLPCAVVDGGILEARGEDVRGAQSHARPWWTGGLAARLSIGATSPRVDVELGAVVPLNQDTFRFTPDEFVYSATGLAAFAAAGLSFAL